jgi:hypothetical protein
LLRPLLLLCQKLIEDVSDLESRIFKAYFETLTLPRFISGFLGSPISHYGTNVKKIDQNDGFSCVRNSKEGSKSLKAKFFRKMEVLQPRTVGISVRVAGLLYMSAS